ncbi:SDR family oxidoreductase [Bosea sp. (in: a-proteobacteria)]|jgi:nucleoside-diphosphate-sugar epimerase|uniref:SDR family oxidoreductase n=1 Tax=Bosea sp. (in: a-proteobacteria) TaxID=1871050 RepID=UPI002DDDBB5B|nr:SDR family oxidoreductase [Bosea sp. (in: a-proteobacteria)]HEV2512083.1 SDR family oxidoreductase [Bosea sp. (in: a-proteobacteria)]
MQKKTALVIGATGVSGRALIEHLDRQPDWNVIGVSRKPPYFQTKARFVHADLMDPQSCKDNLGGLSDVTHVFYCAYLDNKVIAETRAPNAKMFANVLPVIEAAAPNLQHVCLLQGTKYYGQYLGPFKTPAKETDPRIDVPHFYYDQQDLAEQASTGKGWSWSAARPHVICGFALGNPLNIITTIATYATLLKEMGQPFTFPGKPGAFTSVYQATDAGLLARAMVWMSTNPDCANQAFNITNGDFFRYQNLWPVFARFFGLEASGVETVDMPTRMAGADVLWDKIVAREGLQQHPLAQLVNWNFANYAFSNDWDVMSDTTKCRRYGFLEFLDSEEMFLDLFRDLQRKKIVP